MSAVLAVGLCAGVWVIFVQGLNLQFPLFDWGW
jgi:hypothetical protein